MSTEENEELDLEELLEIEGGIEGMERAGCGLGCFRGSLEESDR